MHTEFKSGNRSGRFNDSGDGFAEYVGALHFAFGGEARFESILGRIETRGIYAESVEASLTGRQGIKEISKIRKVNHAIDVKHRAPFHPF